MLMDGVDFLSDRHAWSAIGRKAMAVNLSDCAAMAVQPRAALCAVCLHQDLDLSDGLELLRGAQELGLQHDCPVVGGDTNAWRGSTVIAITVAAEIAIASQPILRSGARPGDGIWISGPLGGSILGRHLWFEPRVTLALTLRERLRPTAMIDISDGLALDLWRLLDASGCGATLQRAALEGALHADAIELSRQDNRSPLDHALYDGEDYELLITLPPHVDPAECDELGLRRIGVVHDQAGTVLMQSASRTEALPIRGWEHWT